MTKIGTRRRTFNGFTMGPKSVMQRTSDISSSRNVVETLCTSIDHNVRRISRTMDRNTPIPLDALQCIRTLSSDSRLLLAQRVLYVAHQTTVNCQRIRNNTTLEWATESLFRDICRVKTTIHSVHAIIRRAQRRKIPRKPRWDIKQLQDINHALSNRVLSNRNVCSD
jgi:hypothetical protein